MFRYVTRENRVTTCLLSMMTSSNGNIFRVTGHLCGEFTGPGEFPTQRPVTRSFDVFFDLRLNTRLNKQPWGWWFEALFWSLWLSSPLDKMAAISAEDHFEYILLNENDRIPIRMSLKCVPMSPIDNNAELIPVMALNRREASTWTNADPVHRRICRMS